MMATELRRDASGFTLIELLIALAVTLVITGAALGAFMQAGKANEAAALITGMDDSLRTGMNLVVRDLIQTGQGIPTGGIPLPTGGTAAPVNRPSPPNQNYTFPVAWTSLPAVIPGVGLGPAIDAGPATDMITILYEDTTLPLNQVPLNDPATPGSSISPDGSWMTVDPNVLVISNVPGAIMAGDLLMFSNALGNALQLVTRTDGNQTIFFDDPDALRLNQRAAATQGTILQLQSPPGTFPPTTATRVQMVSYYVDNVLDPTRPRLTRQINNGPRRAVAFSFENFQVSYDLVDGVNNPTNVKEPVPPYTENQIRKVNLFLAARSGTAFSQTRDFFRNNLATQVSLRSMAFVDRYQ